GVDAFAYAGGSQPGVDVDPGDAGCAPSVRAQHLAQGQVAPGRAGTAEKQAAGKLVLAACEDGLVCGLATGRQTLRDGRVVGGCRRPFLWQQQVMDLAIGL